MLVNPYDDRKVSMRRPHGNGDLDIAGASYTRRNANVTEALDMQNSRKLGSHNRKTPVTVKLNNCVGFCWSSHELNHQLRGRAISAMCPVSSKIK